jgi:hypothetical protein
LLTPEEKRAMVAIFAKFMEPRPPDLTIRVRDDIPIAGPDYEADAHLLMALGALVQSASRIEYQLRRAFVTLAGGDHSALVAAGQTSEWLMNMILAVADARSDLAGEPMSALKALISRCRAALQQRHVYIHSLWGTTPNRGPRLTQTRIRE